MSTVRKLEPAEVTKLLARSGKVDLAPYAEALAGLTVGDWGAIELEASDRLAVVKRRYTMAARGQGKRLVYKRVRQNTLPFEVRAPAAPAKAPAPTKAATKGSRASAKTATRPAGRRTRTTA